MKIEAIAKFGGYRFVWDMEMEPGLSDKDIKKRVMKAAQDGLEIEYEIKE